MNPGAVEEGTKGFFATMTGQPFLLAMIVCNLALLGYLYYQGAQAFAERKEEMKMLYENRALVAELLYKCQPSPPSH